MKRHCIILLLFLGYLRGIPMLGQDEFLSSQEIDAVRDVQDLGKRIVLYLDFAQRRLDAIKGNLASKKSGLGQAVQRSLEEYYLVLEALHSTIENARDKRIPVDKPLNEVEKRGAEFLKYLQSLQSASSPGWTDYRFTLEEAISMTQDEVAEAKKGSFPEVQEREPPQMPTAPPPNDNRGGEEGPPRRGQRRQ